MPRTDPRPRGVSSPIAAARLAAGLTQAQLAAKIGCKQVDISRCEHGVCALKAEMLFKIANALGFSMESLMK